MEGALESASVAPSDVRGFYQDRQQKKLQSGAICVTDTAVVAAQEVQPPTSLFGFLPHFHFKTSNKAGGDCMGCAHTDSLLTLEPEMFPIQVLD